MSARKPARATDWPVESAVPPPFTGMTPPAGKPLVLDPAAVSVRKNGIEFRSPDPIPTWTELTVSLLAPHSTERIACKGVVVECAGNRHLGYLISLLFSELTPHAERQLNVLARNSAQI